ncbi:multicopper oxidase domain-containing protein [Clostridium sp. DSM 8431]|nr:multicopper oxidase domain-containing protein [Clostridium sp. DSM 8431]
MYNSLYWLPPGEYVWHCHFLEHEDHDMMRPMKVLDNSYHNQ